jgi:hypothetical protein
MVQIDGRGVDSCMIYGRVVGVVDSRVVHGRVSGGHVESAHFNRVLS